MGPSPSLLAARRVVPSAPVLRAAPRPPCAVPRRAALPPPLPVAGRRVRRRLCAPAAVGEGPPPSPASAEPLDAAAASTSGADGGGGGAAVDLRLPRRRLSVTFTCGACAHRTERLVNPLAWQRGLVLAQCAGCEAWHKLADGGGFIDEIRYSDDDDTASDASASDE